MAKSDSKQVKALNALLKKARSAWKGEEPAPLEPTTQLVLGFLTWNSTVKQAEGALEKIMSHVVDLNEMRVSLHHEIVEMIGVRYPMAEERVIRMREAMFEVFAREHDWRMNSVKSKGKREQREYLDTLPGIPPYVAAQVALLCFGAHALPVDDKLTALLIQEGVAEPDTPPADLESWLLRQIKAGDALEAHLALQHWADGKKMPSAKTPRKKTTAKKAPARKPTTRKKPAKKTAVKKTTKKKATRSRVAKKK